MAGEKSHTANHPTGISGNRRTSRIIVDASGNRGQRVNSRVAVVGSTITRNAPFVHNVSVLCLSQFRQIPQVPNPCVVPVMEISENSGRPRRRPSCTLTGCSGQDRLAREGLSRGAFAVSTGQDQDEDYDPGTGVGTKGI